MDDDEVKNDVQHMTDIINEVNAPVITHSVEDKKEGLCMVQLESVQEEDQIETPIVVTKAKAKRASKAKPAVVVEPEVEVTASLDEVEAVITLPLPEELKVDTKVACPDCGKQMSAKTLKYSHGPNCLVKKQKQGVFTQKVADQRDDEVAREQIDKSVFEEVIEHEVQKRLHNTRACRAVHRQEMVEKLMQNAF